MRIVQITDLHLSDRTDTPAAEALDWAIDAADALHPDLVAFTGDMTTYGGRTAAQSLLAAAGRLSAPWVYTPGNADLRAPGAMAVLAADCARKDLTVCGVRCLLPDTSAGHLPAAERAWLDGLRLEGPSVLLTHYPLDTLDDSRDWLKAWLRARPVELYLAGHRHVSRTRELGGCREAIGRGLDPDKAFGGPPGIGVHTRADDGSWQVHEVAWPHGRDALPAEIDMPPVGWSIHGDPAAAAAETRAAGLQVLELRPRGPDYDVDATLSQLQQLRAARPLYLSWHLPSLSWSAAAGTIVGHDTVAAQVALARTCGVDAFTIHVPQIPAAMMGSPDAHAPVWEDFLRRHESLFGDALAAGVRLSIENIHNAQGTPLDRRARKFATEIGEYVAWIDAVRARLPEAGAQIGAHLDVGHARNNGELGNAQPLGDWYARVGSRITGYHVHQVRPHEETGKLTNHRDIAAAYDRTISYAGFLHAWSTRMIRRAPLFVEVRDPDERRRTVRVLQALFAG